MAHEQQGPTPHHTMHTTHLQALLQLSHARCHLAAHRRLKLAVVAHHIVQQGSQRGPARTPRLAAVGASVARRRRGHGRQLAAEGLQQAQSRGKLAQWRRLHEGLCRGRHIGGPQVVGGEQDAIQMEPGLRVLRGRMVGGPECQRPVCWRHLVRPAQPTPCAPTNPI